MRQIKRSCSADHPSGVVLHQIWILDDRDQSVVSLEPVYVMSDLFHTVTQFLPEDCFIQAGLPSRG